MDELMEFNDILNSFNSLIVPISSTNLEEENIVKKKKQSKIQKMNIPDWQIVKDDVLGLKNIFEDGTSDEEKSFYIKTYPCVDLVKDKSIHCTSCNIHIGTAPIDEPVIRMHPVLRVTQCRKCYTFYNSGEFDKGEDGSELYCRWCGQGGEVYCCAKCPFVFCKKCITTNLSRNCITEIAKNENWSCFSCSPKIMWHLRAQHWALMNFIEKQKKFILSQSRSEEEINQLMSRDLTTCCFRKKEKPSVNRSQTVINGSPRINNTKKRTAVASTKEFEPKKRATTPNLTIAQAQTIPISTKNQKTLTNKSSTTNQDEVVCTPDILSLFSDNQSNIAETAPPIPTLTLRQFPTVYRSSGTGKKTQTITVTNQAPTMPVYHTINGYRIDLNTAAQQDTFRLPNGKLIQVKKQNTLLPSSRSSIANKQVQNPIILNGTAQYSALSLAQSTTPLLALSDSKSLYGGESPIMKAKQQLEKQVRSGHEICHHIIGKITTLTNSNAYSNIRSYRDVKDIHVHLTYLYTYAINRFKTLQEKSIEDMKKLGFLKEAANVLSGKLDEKYVSDDDDIEIVEPQTTLIELDSDNECESGISKSNKNKKQKIKETITYSNNRKKTIELNKEKDNVNINSSSIDKLNLQPMIVLEKIDRIIPIVSDSSEMGDSEIINDIMNDLINEVMTSAVRDITDIAGTSNNIEKTVHMNVDGTNDINETLNRDEGNIAVQKERLEQPFEMAEESNSNENTKSNENYLIQNQNKSNINKEEIIQQTMNKQNDIHDQVDEEISLLDEDKNNDDIKSENIIEQGNNDSSDSGVIATVSNTSTIPINSKIHHEINSYEQIDSPDEFNDDGKETSGNNVEKQCNDKSSELNDLVTTKEGNQSQYDDVAYKLDEFLNQSSMVDPFPEGFDTFDSLLNDSDPQTSINTKTTDENYKNL